MNDRTDRATAAFQQHQHAVAEADYGVAGEKMSVDVKLKILEERGQTEFIDLFRDWKPRSSPRRRKGAPLDQRVSITVSSADRMALDAEMKAIKAAGDKTTLGALIRNRAMGNVDIMGWRAAAETALNELDSISAEQGDLRNKRKALLQAIETEDDDSEDITVYEVQLGEVTRKLEKLVARGEKRTNRLQGRMSMAESETVKWRAQRLCISTSDYLRMMIFGLEPNSHADSHMSLDAKRRFYISIIEVSETGWGTPPSIFQCSQCETYMEEIRRLRDRLAQHESFG